MERLPDLTKSQLFLDDLWIDDQHKLTRLWHPADIYPEPLMLDGKPWEGGVAMFIEVWDESGQPIDGSADSDRATFDGNAPVRGLVDPATIRWPGDRSLNELAGRRIRLAFLMRDAHLFSFRSSG